MIENKGFLRIKDKITNEAQAQAKETLSAAEEEAKSYELEKKDAVTKYAESELEKIELERQLLEDKMLAQARLQAHKEFLNAREQLIDDLIEKALSTFKRDTEYKKFMKKLLLFHKALMKEPVTLTVAKADIALGIDSLAAAKIKGTVKEGKIIGGFIMEDAEGKRIQETLNSRLERSKDEIRMQISKLIVGENSA